MESHNSTQEQIERTLESIDHISRAEMQPFFYTRLQAQIDKRNEPVGGLWTIVTKPAVSLAALSLLVILNVAVIGSYLRSSKQTNTSQTTTGIQAFAQEYNLDGSSVYNDKTTGK